MRILALLTVSFAMLPAAAAVARPAGALYYETETRAGALVIERLDLSAPHTKTQIVQVGTATENLTVFGIAVAGPYVFWSYEAGLHSRGGVMRASLAGGQIRRLAGNVAAPASLIAVNGFVYWADQNAIGRVAYDGSHLRRHFIVLPQEAGGGVADGLASDGAHLYFSRCQDAAIGRADLDGRHVVPGFISIGPHKRCPQGIAVAGDHIYWTQLGSGTIGRATLDGRGANSMWLHTRSGAQGPFQIVADTSHIYWTWGGAYRTPNYTGRADADGSHVQPRFLLDSLYPMALPAAAHR
jgi:virginiamycin B lyase